ncbi:MAG: dihydroorotate dehydrogenase electron transfer subunit [Spirochaetia bacterium]
MNARRLTLPITSIVRESSSVGTFTFSGQLDVRPGQFLMITDYQTGEKPFSVSCVGEGMFSVTLRTVGPFTESVSRLDVGDFVGIRGAFGSSFFVPTDRKVLLIGGGCGTPPLHFLAQQLVRKRNTVLLLNGARTAAELLFTNRFEALGVQTRAASEDGAAGPAGTVVDLAERLLERERFDRAYAAGPELMLAALRPLLRGKSTPHQFLLERYMKCGIGICGSCAMDRSGILLCVEGPVVDDETLANLAEFGSYRRDESGRKVRFSG